MTLVAERRVVVTGKIPGESRQTAETKLREAGAIVQAAVGSDTDILVTGDKVGAKKINKAKALGVDIIPWHEAISGKASGSTRAPAAPRAPMPAVKQWAPMLCNPGDLPPAGDRWLFEIKWDGIRGVATVKDGGVSLQSRSGKSDLTGSYPEIVEELSTFRDCVLDGELVTMGNELGALPEGCDPNPVARFIVFDVLQEGDQDTLARPLRDRRFIAETIIPKDGCYVAMSPAFEDGQVVLDYAIKHGLEGVVAKVTTSRYIEGARNNTWLKIKIRREQEFVVLGYTEGDGARASTFGALVLGYRETPGVNKPMVYAGKVGTGWDQSDLDMLFGLLEPLKLQEIEGCPWEGFPRDLKNDNVTWVHPEVVVQVAFQRFTEDGILWHPSYKHLRTDKESSDVVRES